MYICIYSCSSMSAAKPVSDPWVLKAPPTPGVRSKFSNGWSYPNEGDARSERGIAATRKEQSKSGNRPPQGSCGRDEELATHRRRIQIGPMAIPSGALPMLQVVRSLNLQQNWFEGASLTKLFRCHASQGLKTPYEGIINRDFKPPQILELSLRSIGGLFRAYLGASWGSGVSSRGVSYQPDDVPQGSDHIKATWLVVVCFVLD